MKSMLSITGRLVVNTISGNFGTFNVGTLYSSIGDFVVKYDGLDEFNEGTYEGQFIVRRTYQKTRKFRVGIIIEPVAEIDNVIFDNVFEGSQDALPAAIPDPIEEEMEEAGVLPEPNVSNEGRYDNRSEDDAKVLFGGLWPLGDTVKLDPTVGRSAFREQRDYLKANGYTFNSKEQSWAKTHH